MGRRKRRQGSSRPWMAFYGNDFFGDTMHLDDPTALKYLRLIWHYWNHGGLPKDDQQLANICRANGTEWECLKGVLSVFFDRQWRHKRIDEELAIAASISEKRRRAVSMRRDRNVGTNVQHMYTQSHSHIKKESGPTIVEQQASQKNGPANHVWLHYEDPRFLAWNQHRRTNGDGKSYPVDRNLGWTFDSEWPPGHPNTARAAWEADLAKRLSPDEYAKAIERIAADPPLADLATNAELRQQGSGAQVIAMAILKAEHAPQPKNYIGQNG